MAFAFGWLRSPRTFGLLSVAAAFGALFIAWTVYLCFMFTGALLRMVLVEKDESAKRWLFIAIGSIAGILFLWIRVVGSEFLLALVLPIPVFVLMWNRLTHPVLLWLGGISYSLYLFHLPLIRALAKVGMPSILFVVASISLSLALAALVYRWVERPMIAWGKAVSAKLVNSSVAGEARPYGCAG